MCKIWVCIGLVVLAMLACSSPTGLSAGYLDQVAEVYRTITIPVVTIIE